MASHPCVDLVPLLRKHRATAALAARCRAWATRTPLESPAEALPCVVVPHPTAATLPDYAVVSLGPATLYACPALRTVVPAAVPSIATDVNLPASRSPIHDKIATHTASTSDIDMQEMLGLDLPALQPPPIPSTQSTHATETSSTHIEHASRITQQLQILAAYRVPSPAACLRDAMARVLASAAPRFDRSILTSARGRAVRTVVVRGDTDARAVPALLRVDALREPPAVGLEVVPPTSWAWVCRHFAGVAWQHGKTLPDAACALGHRASDLEDMVLACKNGEEWVALAVLLVEAVPRAGVVWCDDGAECARMLRTTFVDRGAGGFGLVAMYGEKVAHAEYEQAYERFLAARGVRDAGEVARQTSVLDFCKDHEVRRCLEGYRGWDGWVQEVVLGGGVDARKGLRVVLEHGLF